MSIHLYDLGYATHTVGGLATWFENNKNGRLNNITAQMRSDTLMFSVQNHTYAFLTIKYPSTTDQTVLQIMDNIGSYTTAAKTNRNYDSNYYKFRRAIMCSNGLLFHGEGVSYSGSSGSTNVISTPDVGFTFDKNGDPVVFYRKNPDSSYYRLPTNVVKWQFLGTNTRSLDTYIYIQPRYSAKRTCLAPVIPDGDETNNYCPYCWTATHTQLSSEGLNAVRINDVDYITNGGIYIRDTPVE